jgi:arginine N-succinyltransferase
MMVLEDTETGQVRGTCQIFGLVGQHWPFYSYRIGTDSKRSEQLNRTFHAEVLTLSNDLNGCSEVGGLFLHPAARSGGLGLLLSRSRYLFIASHRARFADRILAELRGVIDEAGSSPFWDGVAGKFFGMSFQEADEFNAMHGNQFIADLMPKHPIYITMLTEAARHVIGVPHPTGRAAMRMLENEGFRYEKFIDIFDGGPTMIAHTDQVASIANAAPITITAVIDDGPDHADGTEALIATGRLADFRCCFGHVTEEGAITRSAAELLGVEAGQEIIWVGR